MATKNPSLNLAQAVQIMTYEIFLASSRQVETSVMEYATVDEVEAFYQRINNLVQKFKSSQLIIVGSHSCIPYVESFLAKG